MSCNGPRLASPLGMSSGSVRLQVASLSRLWPPELGEAGPPQSPPKACPATIVFVSVSVPNVSWKMPPPVVAVLLLSVLLVRVDVKPAW